MNGPPRRAEERRPLIAHVVYRFAVGGLENGLANLINGLPHDEFRHAIVSLTDVSDYRRRIERDDVALHSLHKAPGHAFRLYPRLYRLFRELSPAIVHTRNLAALESAVPAWAAGVGVRIHGEHGRDVNDLDGSVAKYRWVRRAHRPFVSRYVALSRDLERYLIERVGVPAGRVDQIYNGVDTARFRPRLETDGGRQTHPFGDGCFVVGTIGRMQSVKHQTLLARAFVHAAAEPDTRERLRLVMAGDGPLRQEAQDILRQAGMAHMAWLPGERDDPELILRDLDCFVLPSLAEGISNTILEAMASGLPVIATEVGGNAELIDRDVTGRLVASNDVTALARAIIDYARHPRVAGGHGTAGRRRAQERFSLQAMIEAYRRIYRDALRAGSRGQASLGHA